MLNIEIIMIFFLVIARFITEAVFTTLTSIYPHFFNLSFFNVATQVHP